MNLPVRPLATGLVRLRRDGLPPLRFQGACLGRHDGMPADPSRSSCPTWHVLALYRGTGGVAAVAIEAWRGTAAGARPWRCHAMAFPSLDEALAALETHDPDADLFLDVVAPAPDAPPIAVLLGLLGVEAARREVARRYRIGVGSLLAGLAWQDG